MKTNVNQSVEQPVPFTPGMAKAAVRHHAFELYRDKLRHGGHLTLDEWVLAEKDLVSVKENDGLLTR